MAIIANMIRVQGPRCVRVCVSERLCVLVYTCVYLCVLVCLRIVKSACLRGLNLHGQTGILISLKFCR